MSLIPLCLFFALVGAAALAFYPIIRRAAFNDHACAIMDTPLWTLATCSGLASFFLLFALLGRFISSYAIITILALSLMFLAGFMAGGWHLSFKKLRVPWFFLFFLVLQVSFLIWRAQFPHIDFDERHYGGEKAFNLALQQSFLHGHGYPPHDLWLPENRISYYILPRILPGIVSQFSLILTNDPMTGGFLFHLADTFYLALACTTVAAGAMLFALRFASKTSPAQLLTRSFAIGLAPLLATPWRAIAQILHGVVNFWDISRIIPHTINEYPFWNFLWADNHAHSNAEFFQVSALIWILWMCLHPQKLNRVTALLTGVHCAVLAMAHSWGALIGISVLGPMCLWALTWHSSQKPLFWRLMKHLALAGGFAALVGSPDLLLRQKEVVLWYLVPAFLATKLSDFLNVNFSVFLIIAMMISYVLIGLPQKFLAKMTNSRRQVFWLTFGLGVSGVCGLMHFATLAFCVSLLTVCAVLSGILERSTNEFYPSFIGLSVIFSWIVPELFATNLNMDYWNMRINSVFKYSYDAFFSVPLGFSVAFGAVFWGGTLSKMAARTVIAAAIGTVALLGYVQAKTMDVKLSLTRPHESLHGFDFMRETIPIDNKIITYLSKLSGPVIVAELCGPNEVDRNDFSIAGRMATYSGWPGICGWREHVSMHHTVMQTGNHQGTRAIEYALLRNFWLRVLLRSCISQNITPNLLETARQGLRADGITHVVFGEYEKSLFPMVKVQDLAPLGKLVFSIGEYGVIEFH